MSVIRRRPTSTRRLSRSRSRLCRRRSVVTTRRRCCGRGSQGVPIRHVSVVSERPRLPRPGVCARVFVDGHRNRLQCPRSILPEPAQSSAARGRNRRLHTRSQRHDWTGVRPVRLYGGDRRSVDAYQEDYPGGPTDCSTLQYSDGAAADPMFYARKHSPLLLTWSQAPDALVVNDGPGGAEDSALRLRRPRQRARSTFATSLETSRTPPPRRSGTSPGMSSSAGSHSSFRACVTPGTTRTGCVWEATPTGAAGSRRSTAGWSSIWTASVAMWGGTLQLSGADHHGP